MVRVLISTFGHDPSNVLRALRWLPYDRLVLIASSDSVRSAGFRTLRGLERASGSDIEVVRVDPFDFGSCFEGARGAIERHLMAGDEVRVNLSGGTKVLADAALLAAFHGGIEAWHCGDAPVRLPVLRGVRFSDSLSSSEYAVLRALRKRVSVATVVAQLRAEGHGETSVNGALVSLRERGLIAMKIHRGHAVAALDPRTAWFTRRLSNPPTSA